MRKSFTFTLTMLLFSLIIPAQAQRLGQRTAQRSGEQAKPTGQNMSPQQQQNVNKLINDLKTIQAGSQVTAEMKQALKNDLLAMADGATKPDQALVTQLANDLSAALADKTISEKEKQKLAKDLYAVMNSANIPTAEVQQAITDAQTLLQASGLSKQSAQLIVSDLQAIATEAQKNLQNAGATIQSKRGAAAAGGGRLRRN